MPTRSLAAFAASLLIGTTIAAAEPVRTPQLGRLATTAELQALDLSIGPDGVGLPPRARQRCPGTGDRRPALPSLPQRAWNRSASGQADGRDRYACYADAGQDRGELLAAHCSERVTILLISSRALLEPVMTIKPEIGYARCASRFFCWPH